MGEGGIGGRFDFGGSRGKGDGDVLYEDVGRDMVYWRWTPGLSFVFLCLCYACGMSTDEEKGLWRTYIIVGGMLAYGL